MKLKDTEHICPECKGAKKTKQVLNKDFPNDFKYGIRLCPKCHGEGKLDWVENIVGKKPKRDKVMVGSSAPELGPISGDLYYDPVDNKAKVFDGQRWLETSG